jgi:pimeloyl-ACP methyl ester carboxylesterase
VRAGDVTIYVQEEGPASGPPVLLLHGTGAWSEIWRGTMHTLARAGYRAIAIDLPPFGFSARPAIPSYDDASQARRILGVLDALHLDRATFVGHSFSARATAEAALLSPERVERLILVDAAVDIDPPANPEASPRALTALLNSGALRDAGVALTLTNPLLTRTLLLKLISVPAAATQARIEMLQRPMSVRGTTAAYGAWLSPFLLSHLGCAGRGDTAATGTGARRDDSRCVARCASRRRPHPSHRGANGVR